LLRRGELKDGLGGGCDGNAIFYLPRAQPQMVEAMWTNPTVMNDQQLETELSQVEAALSQLEANGGKVGELEARQFRLNAEIAFRRGKEANVADFPFNNDASQAERKRVIENDRKVSTFMAHAAANIDDDRGGRYAAVGSSPRVTGASPISYPQQPSPWHHDPVGLEPPLGFSVEDHDPVGEPHELARDAADTPSTAGEFGHHVADGEGAAATVCRQSISDSWLGNLRECLAHLV
jgi:hypothetical protein